MHITIKISIFVFYNTHLGATDPTCYPRLAVGAQGRGNAIIPQALLGFSKISDSIEISNSRTQHGLRNKVSLVKDNLYHSCLIVLRWILSLLSVTGQQLIILFCSTAKNAGRQCVWQCIQNAYYICSLITHVSANAVFKSKRQIRPIYPLH